jgi:preprotein translocase subunit SecA
LGRSQDPLDRHLIGRCGRQGDPGTIEVIASLEDELMTVFAARLAAVLNRAPLVNATRHWPLRARRDQFRAPPDIP